MIKMKNQLLFLFLSSVLGNANAQLTNGEYFFDTDPASGNGTAIPFASANSINQTITIPTTALSSGFHNLFIRVKDASNMWSHYEGRTLYVIPTPDLTPQPHLIAGEWFLDTDPGLGNGNTIAFSQGSSINTTITLDNAALISGFHSLFIRVKDASGVWSHYEGREFTNDPLGIESNDLYKITIYPNPTNSILNIQMAQKINAMTIVDMTGRVAAFRTRSSNSFDISDLANGVYFVEIITQEGHFRKKFIKN